MAPMRTLQGRDGPAPGLSAKDRGAIEQFLVYIEERVKDVEPVCAELVRMARLALAEPMQEPGPVLH